MLGPVFDLLLDAVDMAMTVLVVLALWDGRKPEVRSRIAGWLTGPRAKESVEEFAARARAARASRLEPARPVPVGSPHGHDGVAGRLPPYPAGVAEGEREALVAVAASHDVTVLEPEWQRTSSNGSG